MSFDHAEELFVMALPRAGFRSLDVLRPCRVWMLIRFPSGTYSFRHLPPLIGACTDDIWQVGWPQQYCARDIALNSDKSAYHKQIFVYTDCESGIPNKTGQNPIFDSPGVPLDRGLLAEYFAQWKKVPQGQQASGVSVSAWKDPSTVR